ncbi:MAG: hypothetical protein J0I09_13475 [Sphingobacteriia bacterium]|nr:hypothetical protein [Sphingobacteriia bacterium]
MLTKEELAFIQKWEGQRIQKNKNFAAFVKGLSRGMFVGIGILAVLSAGWYQRANMVANTMFNPFLLVFIILIIAIFIAFIYRQYTWEQNEQHYKELLARKKRRENEQ